MPYIYAVSQFIIGAVYVLVFVFLIGVFLFCGFFVLRLGFLACFFGSENTAEDNPSENTGSIGKDALSSLPVLEFRNSGIAKDDANCGICLCPYEDDDKIMMLPCGHHFHSECAQSWLSINKTCPYCKHPADKEVNQEILASKMEEVETISV